MKKIFLPILRRPAERTRRTPVGIVVTHLRLPVAPIRQTENIHSRTILLEVIVLPDGIPFQRIIPFRESAGAMRTKRHLVGQPEIQAGIRLPSPE